MADKKISQLTAATTPLAGTEVLPIVQSGTTKKVAVSDLTAGRAVAMAGGSFTDNITQSTAAKGINFISNTPTAGMTSQLLNWYEEGTFTPVAADAATGGNVATSASASGRYTRIGNIVTVNFTIYNINTTGMTAGNPFYIRGLPFANNSSEAANGVVDMRNTAFITYPTVNLGTSASAILFFEHVSGAGVNAILVSAVTGSSIFFVSLTYSL
jgi:hypothetical protein